MSMRERMLPLAVSVGILSAVSAPAFAAVDRLEQKIGVPRGDSFPGKTLDILVTIVVNGKPVQRTVNVAGITAWVPTPRGQIETISQWNQRRTNERTAASKKKAETIVTAINAAFAAEFAQLGEMASVGQYAQKDPLTQLDGLWGLYTIPGVPERFIKDRTRYTWTRDPTKEGSGDGVRFLPGAAPSGGSKGAMGFTRFADAVAASGEDPSGEPSLVELGIEEIYVAELVPIEGTLDEDVLRELEALLDAHGMPATYDPSLFVLTLDNPIPDGQTFRWGNTDTDLEFFVSFEAIVPEPSTLLLFIGGLTGLAALLQTTPRD